MTLSSKPATKARVRRCRIDGHATVYRVRSYPWVTPFVTSSPFWVACWFSCRSVCEGLAWSETVRGSGMGLRTRRHAFITLSPPHAAPAAIELRVLGGGRDVFQAEGAHGSAHTAGCDGRQGNRSVIGATRPALFALGHSALGGLPIDCRPLAKRFGRFRSGAHNAAAADERGR